LQEGYLGTVTDEIDDVEETAGEADDAADVEELDDEDDEHWERPVDKFRRTATGSVVAAGAPVPDLVELFKVNIETTIGKVLISMALRSWERVYHDARLDQIVRPAARPLVARIAGNCLYGRKQILGSVPGALVLGLAFVHTPPWRVEPWRTIATRNAPGQTPIHAPILIVQGAADTIVDPRVTERLVHRLCARGDAVQLRLLTGAGHLVTGHEAAPEVERWLAARFAGTPVASSCT
jgi:pimeloyl-ACP methyl ester carboxylesterase